jgi:hypothetical protein
MWTRTILLLSVALWAGRCAELPGFCLDCERATCCGAVSAPKSDWATRPGEAGVVDTGRLAGLRTFRVQTWYLS